MRIEDRCLFGTVAALSATAENTIQHGSYQSTTEPDEPLIFPDHSPEQRQTPAVKNIEVI